MTPRSRLLLVAAAVVALVVAFVVAQGSGDDGGGSDSAGTQAQTSSAPGAATSSTATTDDARSSTTTTAAAPKPPVPVIRVVDAKPQAGVKRLSFEKGDQIRFRVVSDTADEIHVHGYDVHKDVEAGGSVSFSFPATIEGRFDVELEERATQIVELEVTP